MATDRPWAKPLAGAALHHPRVPASPAGGPDSRRPSHCWGPFLSPSLSFHLENGRGDRLIPDVPSRSDIPQDDDSA